MENKGVYLVDAAVATIWTNPDSPRGIDQGAVSNPVLLREWLDSLTFEALLDLCNSNLVQSQALCGQEVMVLEEKGDWVLVVVPEQPSSKNSHGYPGWMPKGQLKKKEEDYTGNGVAVVTSPTSLLYHDDGSSWMELSFQTRLPLVEESEDWVKVKTPSGTGLLRKDGTAVYASVVEIPKGNGQQIVEAGKAFLDLPYLWGGMSGFGFDCSGFSYAMCKANGYIIPRDAHDQAKEGENVALDQLKPGDLLFFAYDEGKGAIHHVGIYYGNGQMIHSPKTGKTIEVIDLKDTIYERELCAARRYWT
ncbi:NlpC/P60 family protein [Bacillus songklensis]|uniref:NlpC/P60 family protein n=1 Tax=Bacillus songklensis TaxID=1069116 RepID=A0ABV8B4G9_9BACI